MVSGYRQGMCWAWTQGSWRSSPTLMVLWLSEVLWHFRRVLFGKRMKIKILVKKFEITQKSTTLETIRGFCSSFSHLEVIWTFSRNNEKILPALLGGSISKRTSPFSVKFLWKIIFPLKPTCFPTSLVLGFWVNSECRCQHETFKNSSWELMGNISFPVLFFLWIAGFWLNHWEKRMSLWWLNA